MLSEPSIACQAKCRNFAHACHTVSGYKPEKNIRDLNYRLQTSSVFKWSKVVLWLNGRLLNVYLVNRPVTKCYLKSRQPFK